MYLLGFDIGSSFIKTSLLNAETGKIVSSASSPKKELEIIASNPGWAEQHPEVWWKNLKLATKKILATAKIEVKKIKAIGISCQMHGLVLTDKHQQVLRPSIIWCDSRAVEIGNKAFQKIGKRKCLSHFLNSPGNFTVSKLKWVKDNEPRLYSKIYKFMLPGDYIVMRLTNKISTTPSGLSEAILWDFQKQSLANILLDYFKIPTDLIPDIIPTFSIQGELTSQAAKELGLYPNIPVSYRAGDQPNNAFSLNVLEPGEIAATAGTSGVVYGVNKQQKYDEKSRINIFLHVNHTKSIPRYGVLLCINGTGILYNFLKNKMMALTNKISYQQMDALAEKAPIGSEGLMTFPFGNGAERILENQDVGYHLINLRFNTHNASHILRSAQEGIAFSFKYGLDIMKKVGVNAKTIKAGYANMFLSHVFCQSLASLTGSTIELYQTDGAQGAARAAGYGIELYKNIKQAFIGLQKIKTIQPDKSIVNRYQEAYTQWLSNLDKILKMYDKN